MVVKCLLMMQSKDNDEARVPEGLRIRKAEASDAEPIQNLYRHAFPREEGEGVAVLACELLQEGGGVVSLVAVLGDSVIGHVAFSPVTFDADDASVGSILAPLAVACEHRNAGVGTSLVEAGIRRVTESGASLVFVYGDPKYYSRFGFRTELAEGFVPPCELQYPFGWQAMTVGQGLSEDLRGRISCVAPLCRPELW